MAINIATRIEEFTNSAVEKFITNVASNMADMIAPVAISGTAIYILLFSYNIAMGHVQAPVSTAIKRALVIAFVGGLALSFGSYNSTVVGLFQGINDGLVSAVNRNHGSLGQAIDHMGQPLIELVQEANHQAELNGNMLGMPDLSFYLVGIIGFIAWLLFFAVGIGLYMVAMVGLGICLGIGPVFIMLALWPATQQYTEKWLAQCAAFCILSLLISAIISIFGEMLRQFAETVKVADETSNLADVGALLFMSLGLFVVLINLDRLATALTGGIAMGGAHGVATGMAQRVTRTLTGAADRLKSARENVSSRLGNRGGAGGSIQKD